jgi:phosphate-selective porin
MKTYNIPVIWQVIGTHSIEAECLQDAIKEAYNMTTTKNSSYINDSYEVDIEGIPAYNDDDVTYEWENLPCEREK